MATFVDGDFVFQEITYNTCRIGMLNNQEGNCVSENLEYSNPAIIPNTAVNKATGRRYKVVETSKFCFKKCTKLKSVTLPNTLEIIEWDTFYATSISNILIPKSVKKIKCFGFSNMYSLETIVFEPGSRLEIVEYEIFYSCTKLTRVVFPTKVKTIGIEMFSHAPSTITIDFIYCGRNRIETADIFTSPAIVNVFVTNIYPDDRKIGGINANLLTNNTCDAYFNYYEPRVTSFRCKKTNINIILINALIYSN